MHQHATIEDTVYFWFASNDTSGSGGDGATPLFDVREAGATAGAIPLLSGTPTLLTHANYPAGCHEIAVAATTANGFAADDTFAVFCTLAIDSQNPSGFVGSCTLTPLAKSSEITALNDIAATDIVSGGAITTSGGAVSTVATLTNLPAITSNWLTAAGIAASALDGKGDWNIGKTGYSLTQAFPTNFSDMSISVTTGLVDITQTAADKVWGTASRILTASTNFNDIAATDIVSGGAINTTGGAVDTVTTCTTTTTNTDMLTAAAVNAEVVDVLVTDTHAEPAQGTPAATASLKDKIGYLYKAWRNKSTQTATTYSLFNDDASTVDHKATVSDDATTATKGEVATGP